MSSPNRRKTLYASKISGWDIMRNSVMYPAQTHIVSKTMENDSKATRPQKILPVLDVWKQFAARRTKSSNFTMFKKFKKLKRQLSTEKVSRETVEIERNPEIEKFACELESFSLERFDTERCLRSSTLSLETERNPETLACEIARILGNLPGSVEVSRRTKSSNFTMFKKFKNLKRMLSRDTVSGETADIESEIVHHEELEVCRSSIDHHRETESDAVEQTTMKPSIGQKFHLINRNGITLEHSYIIFLQLPELGASGVMHFVHDLRGSTLIIRYRITESGDIIAWSANSAETPDQQFQIISVEDTFEIIWTAEGDSRSRFVAMPMPVQVDDKSGDLEDKLNQDLFLGLNSDLEDFSEVSSICDDVLESKASSKW